MTIHSVTFDFGSFNEDMPKHIIEAIYNFITAHHREPRYILLGHKQYDYLRMEFSRSDHYYLYRIEQNKETIRGVEILRVARDSFFEVV